MVSLSAAPLSEGLSRSACFDCGRRGSPLCDDCSSAQRTACSGPLIASVDRVLASWAYEGAPRSLILGLKLSGERSCARPLVSGVARTIRREGLLGDVLTWVPARKRDIKLRGLDHAEVLARHLGRAVGLPVRKTLVRARTTRDQTGLDRLERERNLEGAFAALAGVPLRVTLVDDLVTTGATAHACARALRDCGARSVEVVVPCRA
jgi:competence protein ComFC